MSDLCEISHLVLDSRLAGAKIGKIVIDKGRFDPGSFRRSLKQFDLVYVFTKMDPVVLRSFYDFDWVFASVKIVFHSKLRSIIFPKFALTPPDIFGPSDRQELVRLAQDLSLQSRFFPDSHVHQLGKKIYTEWMKNSLSGKAADTILVCRNPKGTVIGFATVKENNGIYEPVLVKVSEKYKGMGHGRELMHKFFNYAASKNPRCSVMINAMLHNAQALNFYHTLGLKVQDHQHVYHVYPKGFKNF